MRFVFDTSVLIDYLREDRPDDQEVAADAFAVASRLDKAVLTMVSLMELYGPMEKGKTEIESDLSKVARLIEEYGIRVVPCSRRAQKVALEVLKHHRSMLGKNALTDSLIIASGLVRRAYLVTKDNIWSKVMLERKKRDLFVTKVVSPVDLVQERF